LIRHCERSEAIQTVAAEEFWMTSLQEFLATTLGKGKATNVDPAFQVAKDFP